MVLAEWNALGETQLDLEALQAKLVKSRNMNPNRSRAGP